MKFCGLLLLSLALFGVFEAAGSEYSSRRTGVLIHGNNGAVLLGDDGNRYHVPVISREFLNRHAGSRITLIGNVGLLTGSGDDSRVIYADEIIVTAPATERKKSISSGTEAAEAAQLIIPPLIPPF